MRWQQRVLVVVAMTGVIVGAPDRADAQLGALMSPGALSRAHADLEGLTKCQQCHERGRQVSAERCLTCHKAVAERIAKKTGVHRDVKQDCVRCHVEHTGLNGELRPFRTTTFNHAAETGFALDGKHAPVAGKCATCHKARTFLDAKPACASCHADVHKGELGAACQRCHSTTVEFQAATRTFDHASTRFPLTGAHRSTTCVSCHANSGFTGLQFGSCANCHKSPHVPSSASPVCTTCHTTSTWTTKTFDHSTTTFPLIGRHATAACASCHKVAAMKAKPAAATCATCHADPHKGEFKQDCKACHDEKGFAGAAFDHAASTTFALVDGHAGVACRTCHAGITAGGPVAKATVDFRGVSGACATCHRDPHNTELGTTCTTCHSSRTFRVAAFTHPGPQGLFVGQHTPLACDRCHEPKALAATRTTAAKTALGAARFTATPTACASCHRDVHLGQVGTECQTCHSVSGAKFAPDRFTHERAAFALTGAHATVTCDKCHASVTSAFPTGSGTAVRLKGVGTTCATCHADVHLGQLSQACETCHTTGAFAVGRYTHKTGPTDFFIGPHRSATCVACHKPTTERFPAGPGTAVKFKVSAACATCHTDVHRGAMGPNCRECHKLSAAAVQLGTPVALMDAALCHTRGQA